MDQLMEWYSDYLTQESDFGSFGETTLADWTSGDREMTLKAIMCYWYWTEDGGDRYMDYDYIYFEPEDIVSYTIDEQNGSAGIDIGSVVSGSYKLVLDNTQRHLKPADFKESQFAVVIGIKIPGREGIHYEPFGVWHVLDVSAPEQSAVIEITGLDALGVAFTGEFYPMVPSSGVEISFTFDSLMDWIMGSKEYYRFIRWSIPDSRHDLRLFWNDDEYVPRTLHQISASGDIIGRDVLSWLAAYMGCYVRMSRDGDLQFRAYDRIYAQGEPQEIDPSTYFTFTPLGIEPFEYNCLRAAYYKTENIDQEGVVEQYVDSSVAASPSNTIQISSNPFMTTTRASILHNLFQSNLTCEPLSLTFMGAPMVDIGDHYYVRDLNGNPHKMIVNSMSATYDGGLSMMIACDLPSDNTQYSSAYGATTSMRMEFAKRGGWAQYTESEVSTGTKWIDGRPMYRRLIVWPAGATSGTAIQIGDQIEYCTILWGMMSGGNSNSESIYPSFHGSNTNAYVLFYVNRTQNTVIMQYGSIYTCYRGGWALIEYTKTSDPLPS